MIRLSFRADGDLPPALHRSLAEVVSRFGGRTPDAAGAHGEFERGSGEETADRALACAWEILRRLRQAWLTGAGPSGPFHLAVSDAGAAEAPQAEGVWLSSSLEAPLFVAEERDGDWRRVYGWVTGLPGLAASSRPAMHGATEPMLSLRALAAAVQETERPAVAYVVGERGGGKTLFLDHAAASLLAAGFTAHLVPSTDEARSPMASLARLVQSVVRLGEVPATEDPAEEGRGPRSVFSIADALKTQGMPEPTAIAVAAAAARIREVSPLLAEPLLTALRAASAIRPQVVLLDDAQLLAPETLALVRALTVAVSGQVLFLLAVPPEHLARVEGATRAGGGVPTSEIALPTLNDETAVRVAHAALGGPVGDPDALQTLMLFSRRNPCLFLHALYAMCETGALRWKEGKFDFEPGGTPPSPGEAARGETAGTVWGGRLRAERLRDAPPVRQYAEAAATIGFRFRPAVVRRMLGPESRAADILDHLYRCGILWPVAAGGEEWRWSHPEIRRAVLSDLAPAELSAWEAAAADAQLKEPALDPAAALSVAVKLWERAGRPERAAMALVELARRSVGADHVARGLEQAEHAVRLWETAGRPLPWLRVALDAWMEAGRCAGLLGRAQDSVRAFEQASVLAEQLGDERWAVRVLRERGWAELRAGAVHQARFRAAQLVERAGESFQPAEQGDALSLRAAVESHHCRWGAAEADLRAAYDHYRNAGREAESAQVEHRYAELVFRRGEVRRALRVWARLARDDRRDVPERIRAYASAGVAAAQFWMGRFEQAIEAGAAALARAQRCERVAPGVRGQSYAALARAERGEVGPAWTQLRTLERWAHISHDPLVHPEVLCAQALLLSWVGRADDAVATLRRAREELPGSSPLDVRTGIDVLLARALVRSHAFSEARDLLEEIPASESLDQGWLFRGDAYGAWAELNEAVGDREEAREWAGKAQRWYDERELEVLAWKAAGLSARNGDPRSSWKEVRRIAEALRGLGALRAAAMAAVWAASFAERAGAAEAGEAWAAAEAVTRSLAPTYGEFADRLSSRDALRTLLPED